MSNTYEIKHRWTGGVLYDGGGESLRDVVVQAVNDGASLAGAYLADSNLAGAYLAGANLARANLAGAYLADSNLADANLARADLADANLARANLADSNLAGANLAGADLAGADLAGADLAGADLAGAKIGSDFVLIGRRPVLQIGPIGSRCALLSAYLTDAGVMIRAGCFFGTLDEFRAACIETHGESVHGREYAAAITLIETHAELWSQESAR